MLSIAFPKLDLVAGLTFLLIVVGVVLISIAVKKMAKDTVRYDVTKDLGIALITAAVVTLVYNSVLDLKKLSDLFTLIIGSDVREEVLNVAREEVFKREIMRENAELRFTVVRDPGLSGQALIKLQIDYDIFTLKPDGDDHFVVTQELEHQNMWNPQLNLPRFDRVVIGNDPYEGDALRTLVKDGRFTSEKPYTLQTWPKVLEERPRKGLHITTKRTELVYIPGSYHIVMGELTKGVKVYIEAPDDVKHVLKNWFVRKGPDFKQEGEYNKFEGIILPGQGLTIQFSEKAPARPGAKPAQPAARRNGGAAPQ